MPRASLSADAVVAFALETVDEAGAAALTLSAVAARASVATPSLYKHVRGLAELRDLVSARIMDDLADEVGQAVLGRSGEEALRAFMRAWRSFALRAPHRYAAMLQTPEPRTAEAGERLLDIIRAALRAYGMTDSAAVHMARCLRAAVHGFAVLEAEGAFGLPESTDDSYDLLVSMMAAGAGAQRAAS